jgi:hypothetical protein
MIVAKAALKQNFVFENVFRNQLVSIDMIYVP